MSGMDIMPCPMNVSESVTEKEIGVSKIQYGPLIAHKPFSLEEQPMDLFEREIALESEMIGLGDSRMWKNVLQSRETEQESRTLYARRIMTGDGRSPGALEAFTEAIRKFMTDAKLRPGKHHSLVAVLEQFDNPAVVAFIALQICLDSISLKRDLTWTSVQVGRSLEDELRFTKFEKENKAFWKTLIKDLREREPNMNRRRGILIHEMKKGADKQAALVWKPWTKEEQLMIGLRTIEILAESTGLLQIYTAREKQKTVGKLSGTPETLAWINEFMEKGGLISPSYLPTIIPPKPWTGPVGGGYHLETLRKLRLVKVDGKEGMTYLYDLETRPEQMRPVYAALNAVQETPWKINRSILDVMKQAAAVGLAIGKAPMMLPAKNQAELEAKMPLPPKPSDIDTNVAARKEWSRSAAKVYAARVKQISQSLQHNQLLWLAEKFAPEEAIYFPMQLDFRGRMYAIPSTLNPQGADPAKGLLTFARGKKLGASGLRWLLIHTANMWGEDKISLDAREQWALDNLTTIISSALEPFDIRWWMKADKPWEFLAACFELAAAYRLDEPTDYVSSLPVTVDGTCNGLQHFSAMLLDEKGAEAVNLKPSDVPQDIYQRVADQVRTQLLDVVAKRAEGHEMAKAWLDWGFDRKATKRAVMIVPYSGTEFAAKEYTVNYIEDRKDCPFDDPYQPAYFFTRYVWKAISHEITSAKQAMDWLRIIGKVVATSGQSLTWTTPVGFPVRQSYVNLERYRVKTHLGNQIVCRPALLRPTTEMDHRAMEQGISPNFVHSLDAACLMLTVNRSVDEGVHNFAMVHDSYGVLAADMDTLYVGLRQAFVDIYQTDVMEAFVNEATKSLAPEQREKIPPAPMKGSFQLEAVKDSKYFFA